MTKTQLTKYLAWYIHRSRVQYLKSNPVGNIRDSFNHCFNDVFKCLLGDLHNGVFPREVYSLFYDDAGNSLHSAVPEFLQQFYVADNYLDSTIGIGNDLSVSFTEAITSIFGASYPDQLVKNWDASGLYYVEVKAIPETVARTKWL